MAKVVLFDVDQVEEIRKVLREAPEPGAKKITRPQAIRSLEADITRLQSKGYSVAQIAGMLTEHDMTVSSSVLQTYLRDARRAAKNTRGDARRSSTRSRSRPLPARDGSPAPSLAEGAAQDPAPAMTESAGGPMEIDAGPAQGTPAGGRAGHRPGGASGGPAGETAGEAPRGSKEGPKAISEGEAAVPGDGRRRSREARAVARPGGTPGGDARSLARASMGGRGGATEGTPERVTTTNRTDGPASASQADGPDRSPSMGSKGAQPRSSWGFIPREDSDDL
jgi:hypothetical protein